MKRRLLIPAAALAFPVILTLGPISAPAANTMTRWEALVRTKLAAAALFLNFVDAHWAYKPYIGAIGDNTYFDVRVPLNRGVSYTLIGVCDDDCRNLSMRMYDADGEYLGKSAGRTVTPDLEITPEETQRFTVRISMNRCDAEPCYFGLGVFSDDN
jgi:hypothetical protein